MEPTGPQGTLSAMSQDLESARFRREHRREWSLLGVQMMANGDLDRYSEQAIMAVVRYGSLSLDNISYFGMRWAESRRWDLLQKVHDGWARRGESASMAWRTFLSSFLSRRAGFRGRAIDFSPDEWKDVERWILGLGDLSFTTSRVMLEGMNDGRLTGHSARLAVALIKICADTDVYGSFSGEPFEELLARSIQALPVDGTIEARDLLSFTQHASLKVRLAVMGVMGRMSKGEKGRGGMGR